MGNTIHGESHVSARIGDLSFPREFITNLWEWLNIETRAQTVWMNENAYGRSPIESLRASFAIDFHVHGCKWHAEFCNKLAVCHESS